MSVESIASSLSADVDLSKDPVSDACTASATVSAIIWPVFQTVMLFIFLSALALCDRDQPYLG